MWNGERSSNIQWAAPDEGLIVHRPQRVAMDVVHLEGTLTLPESVAALAACTEESLRHVLLDLSRLTFMDCAGWGALVAAEGALRHRGGSLGVTHAVGEPHRLITLVRQLEDERP